MAQILKLVQQGVIDTKAANAILGAGISSVTPESLVEPETKEAPKRPGTNNVDEPVAKKNKIEPLVPANGSESAPCQLEVI